MSNSVVIAHTLYVLKHPETGEIRYFGRTSKTLKERLNGHCKSKRCPHTSNWIKSLGNSKPVIEPIISGLSPEIVFALERFFICSGRVFGMNLTNLSDGGEANALGVKRSDATCAKLAEINRGKPAWNKGISTGPRPQETKLKISKSMKGRKGFPCSEKCKEAVRAANKGNKYCLGRKASPETCIKISEASLGRKRTPEAIAKSAKANRGNKYNLGRVHTPEYKMKMSGILKNSWERRKQEQILSEMWS